MIECVKIKNKISYSFVCCLYEAYRYQNLELFKKFSGGKLMLEGALYGAIIGGVVGLVIALFMIIMKKRGGSVPRFSQLVPYSGDAASMIAQVEILLAEHGYSPFTYNIETGVYKKGTGVATAAKYIKVLPQDDGILVQGFVDVYGTESGLSGFTASVPKKSCKKVVDLVINLIQNS